MIAKADKTLKYVPSYPNQFKTIGEAREWTKKFVLWYNTEHLHSGIKYVTADQRHLGLDKEILKKRHETYVKAQMKNPTRWSGSTRNWEYIQEVVLNKKAEKIYLKKLA